MGYFAGRSAAMGAVGPGVVTATFFNFHPAMVARSIPDAWSLSTPARALEARMQIARDTIKGLLGEPDLGDIVELLTRAIRHADPSGRPLFAGNAAVDPPDDPPMRLWWACTALREHRGDGHVACLTHAGLDGCEANVMAASVGAIDPERQKKFRGWSDEEWSAATARIRDRGLVDSQGRATDEGLAAKRSIEDATDRLAAKPYEVLTGDEIESVIRQLETLVLPWVELGAIRYPNPMGLTAPVRPS
jgi:hypothetical protein